MTINLKQIRKDRGITQEDLAKSSGVTRQTINKIESERCESISTKTLLKLCDALKCSITDLICL